MVRSRVCDVAWRTLDAQFWGVAQRRRRIFLIADFRAVGERKPEILFEQEGLPRDSSPRRKTGQGPAEAAAVCFAIEGNCIDRQPQNGGNGKGYQEGVSYTLTAMDRHAVAQPYSFDSLASNSMKSGNPHSGCRPVDVAKTLDTTTPDPSKNQGGIAVVSYDMTHADEVIREVKGDRVNTLNARMGTGGNQVPIVQKVVGTLMAREFKGLSSDDINSKAIPSSHGVRRLTPLETERLQGLPDGWTKIDHKSCSDTARYKAIGNGMAQPCSDYVMSVVRRMCDERRKDGSTSIDESTSITRIKKI